MFTILSFIVVIGIIVFVHELGHFLAAKAILASKLGTRIVDGALIDRQRPAGHVF